MSARKFMYESVMSVPDVSTVFGNRVMETGAVGGPEGDGDSPDKPFMVIRAQTSQPPIFLGSETQVKQSRFQVWVHDTPGDTSKVDSMVADLEILMPLKTPIKNADGHFMECRWEDSSADSYDDHYQTTVRYVTFLVTWRPASS